MKLNKKLLSNLRESTTDTQLLKILHVLLATSLANRNRATQDRISFHKSITSNTENGWVAIVHGGMDCDCCCYEGNVSLVKATVKAVDAAVESLYVYAEGPIHWEIKSPSAASTVKSSSRDLALEAFENGHSWSVSY